MGHEFHKFMACKNSPLPIFEDVVRERYLLIDAATPLVQVVVLGDGEVLASESSVGNASFAIFPSMKKLLSANDLSMDDFDGMAYCRGPGSALGLRVALIAIKTWMVFSPKIFRLWDYCSLDMCLALNPRIDRVCAGGTGGTLVVKTRQREGVEIIESGKIPSGSPMFFLNTKRTIGEEYQSFDAANNDIAEATFDILSICNPSSGTLEDYGAGTYKKWDGKISFEIG
jgi:hypothetical protein